MIWGLAWHPQGHMLASTGNDWRVRFWGKPKPYEAATGPPAPVNYMNTIRTMFQGGQSNW